MEISKEEWEEWRLSQVTKALLDYLRRSQVLLQEQWGSKMFQGETGYEVGVRNATALGEYEAYGRLLELDVDKLNEVLNDEE